MSARSSKAVEVKVAPDKLGMSDEEIESAIEALIRRDLLRLSEFLSSVQILGTRVKPDGSTQRFAYGTGDIYARAHACQQWLHGTDQVL